MEKCCSCLRLFNLSRLKKIKNNDSSNEILVKILEKTDQNTENLKICNKCFYHIYKSETIPLYSILNNMHIRRIPDEISCLNFYEKMLIQRSKCFQSIIKLKSYGKYKRNETPAIKGLAIHLPLELQSTQDYIVDTLPNAQNMHFLVDGLPTKSNNIWRGIVDLNKVYIALEWLIKNNHLYKDIVINRNLLLENSNDTLIGDSCPNVEKYHKSLLVCFILHNLILYKNAIKIKHIFRKEWIYRN